VLVAGAAEGCGAWAGSERGLDRCWRSGAGVRRWNARAGVRSVSAWDLKMGRGPTVDKRLLLAEVVRVNLLGFVHCTRRDANIEVNH
jgi:hypothetical protein